MTCCTNSTGSKSRYYFNGIVYQGLTEQDTVASSLMAIVKKILNGHSFKRQSETVIPTSRVALSKSIHISTTNSVNIAEVQTPVMSNSIAILTYHLAFYVAFKLQALLLLGSMRLDSAHSVVTMAAH